MALTPRTGGEDQGTKPAHNTGSSRPTPLGPRDRSPDPRPFVPAWWCRGPHAQTLWPYLVRRNPRVTLVRERLELPDGDFLDLDWTADTRQRGGGGPIVLVLHGLEGSSRSKYARGLLAAVAARGWRGVVMHFRNCSGTPNRLARSYHSGETGDLDYVVEQLRAREGTAIPFVAVGYSLGANVLLKWLGERGKQAPLTAAVAVSPPFVLARAAERLERGFSRVYQRALLKRLRASLAPKLATIPLPFDAARLATLKTFRQFDDVVTAPLHGFHDAEDYYRRASCRPYLRHIAIPTLILHARDDPFTTEDAIPAKEELSASVRLELYPHGGHVGFVTGLFPWRARYWLEERIPAFLAQVIGRL